MRITVVTPDFPPMHGGLADYSLAWCEAMRTDHGATLTVVTRPGARQVDGLDLVATQQAWGVTGAADLRAAVQASSPDVVVVQYVPHAFSRRGGGLPAAVLLARLASGVDAPVVVNAHELYGAWSERLRRVPLSVTQRLAVGVLVASCRAVVVTVAARRDRLLRPLRGRVHVIPIGSNLPPQAPAELPLTDCGAHGSTFVLATLGLGQGSQDVGSLQTALDAFASCGTEATLLVAGKLRVEHPRAVHLGYVEPERLTQLLQQADLVVLPVPDGASSRRSTVVSALASGAAVLSTSGADTDVSTLPPTALRLVPAGDRPAFAEAALELAGNPAAREALRAGAREAFQRSFSWPVISQAWADTLGRLLSR